jgi:hypothetical protein
MHDRNYFQAHLEKNPDSAQEACSALVKRFASGNPAHAKDHLTTESLSTEK